MKATSETSETSPTDKWVQDITVTGENSVNVTVLTKDGVTAVFQVPRHSVMDDNSDNP